ncbi:DUF3375 domain-containing protein [Solitalea canadensis]|uniref:DUF3375 domain-containing protein n=1 Tax=Solitalea canadensis (strain ATCC 29591 / DSM 3403 / JCM 21819 / LMG 8368 / NBRC 15130 / NCIMB 12057 / USAM 9D) TaxID=929556 RepID=H8KR37_SOLCM|nr:DUF3375 domain-containing protein [Solitalea canadensis]AFD07243.1 Protein of unknown function (DUF3375) [Solitalea canadensis DSM 3403]
MLESFHSILKVRIHIDSAITLKLLRARNLPLIITFLNREFKENEQMMIPYQSLVQKLGDFLEEIEYGDDDDDEFKSVKLILDFDEKAKLYIDRWIDLNYLRNIMDDSSKVLFVLLSKHTEKAFQFFDLLKEREFVGTESKFKDIFHKLRDIVENANPDKVKRLDELEKRKQTIEEEIRKIKIDGFVTTYEDYQVKSRYEDINRLANELIGDFKEVEDNFKDITRRIYERQQNTNLSKGKLLAETFDALYELRATDQGKSFYAFWQFMLDDVSQADFQKLTKEVYQVLEDRGIEVSSRSLRKLKNLLHIAARRVLDKNGILADKLSREIVAKDQLESRKTRELMSAIRTMAIKRINKPFERDVCMELDGDADVYLPLERKLGEKPEVNIFTMNAESASLAIEDIGDLSKLFNADLIEKKLLLDNIYELLLDRSQISLKEIVEIKGITKGLSELLAYITLVNTSSKFFINDTVKETICFDDYLNKYLELPQIIFSN